MKKLLLCLAVWLLTFFTAYTQIITLPADHILYVKKNAAGNGSGSSWEHAIPELADALKWAHDNQGLWDGENPLQIWVAEGTYKPRYAIDDSPDAAYKFTFRLVPDVEIYGGFAGNEKAFSDRSDWESHPTILSGVLDEPYQEVIGSLGLVEFTNIAHVVTGLGELGKARLDGFTITGGDAKLLHSQYIGDNYVDYYVGGGIFLESSSPKLQNLKIIENGAYQWGGGIAAFFNMEIDPLELTGVSLLSNRANSSGGGFESRGGGLYFLGATARLKDCIIMGNVADDGGGVFLQANEEVTITGCVLAGNEAQRGGGLAAMFSRINLVNSTISGNKGGGIYDFVGLGFTIRQIRNSVIYNHEVSIAWGGGAVLEFDVENSLIEGITSGSGTNLDGNTDPNFLNGRSYLDAPFTDGDYRLATGSLLIDNGDNEFYTQYSGADISQATDAARQPRLQGSSIDIGAYEGPYVQLPVKLTVFRGYREGGLVQLFWETTEEVNASHFEVLRSADGKEFRVLGSVTARGGERMQQYHFVDPSPLGGTGFYRLRSVDHDGKSELSRVVSVKGSRQGDLYPNPVRGENALLSLNNSQGVKVSVYDPAGRNLGVAVREKQDGRFELETAGLMPGLYLVKVTQEGVTVKVEKMWVK